MSIQISQDYSSMVNFARCKVLGANVLRGPNQKPWDGKLEYDYQLWIDSDIVFNTEKFWQLCDNALAADGSEKEVVASFGNSVIMHLLLMVVRKKLLLVGISQKMGRLHLLPIG
jgi:hypothetical protein